MNDLVISPHPIHAGELGAALSDPAAGAYADLVEAAQVIAVELRQVESGHQPALKSLAVEKGNPAIVRELVQRGADVGWGNDPGRFGRRSLVVNGRNGGQYSPEHR